MELTDNSKNFLQNLRENRLKSYEATPGDIEEHRRAELRVAGDTAGRPLIELIQNTDDAISQAPNSDKNRVKILFKNNNLIIANVGAPFTPEGVEAICNLDRSPKINNRISIGNKGIGFKSVLSWTEKPSIYSTTYKFTYSRRESALEINQFLKSGYSLKNVPLMRLPFSPTTHNELVDHLLLDGFVTVIILPLKNEKIKKVIHNELKDFDPLTLLFLNSISHLSIITDNFEKEYQVFREQNKTTIKINGVSIIYNVFKPEENIIPKEILLSLPDDCSDLTHSMVSIVLPQAPITDYYQLFSFFPTSEKCPFKFYMNGDFILDAGRKHLRNDAAVYNQWVIKEISRLFVNQVIPFFSKNDPTIIDFLECRQKEDMEPIESQIFGAFVNEIGKTEFLPVFKNPTKSISPQSAGLANKSTINDILKIFQNEIELKNRVLIDQKWLTHSRLEVLQKFGAEEIKKTEYVKLLGSLAKPDPGWITTVLSVILNWISKAQYYFEKKKIVNTLKRQPLFLTTKNKLRSLSSEKEPPLFLSPSGDKKIDIPYFIPLDFFSPEIGKSLEPTELKKFKQQLQILSEYGLHPFKPREIITKAVLPIINKKDIKLQKKDDQKRLLIFLVQLEPYQNKFEDIDPYPWFDDLRTQLSHHVYVPTQRGDWIEAWKVYATGEWGAPEELLYLYKDILDRYFLALIDGPDYNKFSFDNWKALFRYLGVSWEPKILKIETMPNSISQYSFKNPHPTSVSEHDWGKYIKYINNNQSLADMWDWTIDLKSSYTFDEWRSIRNDSAKSLNFLHLLYKTKIFGYIIDNPKKAKCNFSYTKITRSYSSSCDSVFLWGIKYLDWLPSSDNRYFPPNKIFLADSEIGRGLKKLIPVLKINKPRDKIQYRQFEDLIEEIGIKTKWEEVTISDWCGWLELIHHFNDDYSKENIRLSQNLYRHCIEQCKIVDEKIPFSEIRILSLSTDAKYELKIAKDVIYLDESRFDSIKRELINSGYNLFPVELGGVNRSKNAKELFNLTLASEIIRESVIHEQKSSQMSEVWQKNYERIRPILLARLSKDRPESRNKDEEFFRSVKIIVVTVLKKTFSFFEKGRILFKEEPHFSWSNQDNTLYLNQNSTDKQLWTGIAEALSQRLSQTYYEAFENLILCQSDTDRIEKLRKAGVSEDDVLYCENILKEDLPTDFFKQNEKDLKKEDVYQPKVNEGLTGKNKKESKKDQTLNPEIGDFGTESNTETKIEEIEPTNNIPDIKPTEVKEPPNRKKIDFDRKVEVELAAMDWTKDYEIDRGWLPKDVSMNNCGYDIESEDPTTGKKRFIEVKGASGRPEKREVTINEWQTAIELGDAYYIYYVLGIGSDEGELRIIKSPVKKITPIAKSFDVSLSKEIAEKVILLKRNK